jgi:hypothetical protein
MAKTPHVGSHEQETAAETWARLVREGFVAPFKEGKPKLFTPIQIKGKSLSETIIEVARIVSERVFRYQRNLQRELNSPVRFVCFDQRLAAAAARGGLIVTGPGA